MCCFTLILRKSYLSYINEDIQMPTFHYLITIERNNADSGTILKNLCSHTLEGQA